MKRLNKIIERRGIWWATERVADYFGIKAHNLNDFDVFEYSKKHGISEDYLLDILANDEKQMLEYLAKLIADYGRNVVACAVFCDDRFRISQHSNGRDFVFSYTDLNKRGYLTLEEYLVEIGANVRWLKCAMWSWEHDEDDEGAFED